MVEGAWPEAPNISLVTYTHIPAQLTNQEANWRSALLVFVNNNKLDGCPMRKKNKDADASERLSPESIYFAFNVMISSNRVPQARLDASSSCSPLTLGLRTSCCSSKCSSANELDSELLTKICRQGYSDVPLQSVPHVNTHSNISSGCNTDTTWWKAQEVKLGYVNLWKKSEIV